MRIAVFQFTGAKKPALNIDKIRKTAKIVKEEGAKALFLPECFYSMGDGHNIPQLVTEGGPEFQEIKSLALDFGLYLLGGSVAYYKGGNKRVNRVLNFAPDGKLLSFYDKINLFSCFWKKDQIEYSIDEGKLYQAGDTPLLDSLPPFLIGYGLCFDLRNPVQARKYAQKGANLLTYASAFTVPTGKAHWHTLLKARAIENQCFVVASAQWGKHEGGNQSFGHSLIVGPWGEVLLDLGEGEKWGILDLDLEEVQKVRRRIKIFK